MHTDWINVPRQFWLDPPYTYSKVTSVTQDFSRAETPPQLLLQLLEHQKADLKAMRDLTQIQKISMPDQLTPAQPLPVGRKAIRKHAVDNISVNLQVETRAGVLRDKAGSGKTAVTAAMLVSDKHRKLREITTLWDDATYNPDRFHFLGGKTEVRVAYKRYYPVTLIFVNKIVIDQYINFLQDHAPDLRIFVVEDVFGLREFYKVSLHPEKGGKTIKDYDIVIIKNGDITGKFDPPELQNTFVSQNSKKPIITVFGELYRNILFENVWMDDFDMLGVPGDAPVIPALWTWLISATRNNEWGGRPRDEEWTSVEDILNNYHPKYANLQHNRVLFTLFSIGADTAFLQQSTRMPVVNFEVYTFKNPNETAVGALTAMATQESKVFAEMLNADAVQTAGKKANVKANSAIDVFQKVLGDQWEGYYIALRCLEYISAQTPYINGLNPPAPKTPAYSSTRITEFKKNLESAGPETWLKKNITHHDSRLPEVMSEVQKVNNQNRDVAGKAIDRVRENLKQGDCPIMCIPFRDCVGILIMKCCGLTVSIEGAGMGIRIQDKGTDISGQCPLCRAKVSADTVVVVDQDVNYDHIVNQKLEQKVETAVKVEEPVPPKEEEMTKYRALVLMITKTRAEFTELMKLHKQARKVKLDNLMNGDHKMGLVPEEQRKFLIYVSYNETSGIVASHLEGAKISFAKLTSRREHNVELFRKYMLPNTDPDSLQVLLVPGAKYSAGRDLQNTTDIVFMHKVNNTDVEAQVAGRGQRLGRTSELTIHYLTYSNELEAMRHMQI